MKENAIHILPPEGVDRKLVATTLENAGFPIEVFTSPAELVFAVTKSEPHAIVAPVTYEGEDVFPSLESTMKSLNLSSLPLILTLAPDEAPPSFQVLGIYINRYLAAPFQVEEVVNTLRLLQVERTFLRFTQQSVKNPNVGALENTPPIEVLRNRQREHFTGLVSFTNGYLFGHIAFKDGRMVEAVSHFLHNKHAMYRILSWEVGAYWFQPNFKYIPAKPMRIRATMDQWEEKADARSKEIDRLLGGEPPESLIALPLVSEAQLKTAVTSTFGGAYTPLLLEAGEYLQLLRNSNLGDLETTIQLKKLVQKGILELSPMSREESLSVQMPMGLAELSKRMTKPKTATSNGQSATPAAPEASEPKDVYEVTGYDAPPDFGDLDDGDIWDVDSNHGSMNIKDDLLEDVPEVSEVQAQEEEAPASRGYLERDEPPSINLENIGQRSARGGPQAQEPPPPSRNAAAKIRDFLLQLHGIIFTTSPEEAKAPEFIRRYDILFNLLVEINNDGQRFKAYCTLTPPIRLMIAAEGAMVPIKDEASKEFFVVFGVEEFTIKEPNYDQLLELVRGCIEHREDPEFLIESYVQAQGLTSIRMLEKSMTGVQISQQMQKQEARGPAVPLAEESGDYIVSTWKDLIKLGEDRPELMMENILEQPMKVARMLTRHAEESDPHPGRSGFTPKQLWEMLHGLMLLDKLTRKLEEFDEQERLQVLHMVVDVIDTATLGGVLGLGLDYFGWTPFLKSVLARMERHDLRTAIGHWYRLLQWFFKREVRAGRILLHLRMKLHMLNLSQLRSDFAQIAEDLSRNRAMLGLDPVDLALIAGKTPPEFALDPKLRRLAVQNLLIFRTRENHKKILPLANAYLDKGHELGVEIIRYLVSSMLLHPQLSLRTNAVVFLLDLMRNAIDENADEFLLRILQQMEENLTREDDTTVLQTTVDGLEDIVDRLRRDKRDEAAKRVGQILVRMLERNPRLQGAQREAIVRTTGSISIANVVPRLIEDLRHPDNWQVSYDYLKSNADNVRLPLVEKLLKSDDRTMNERILKLLGEIGVSGLERFDSAINEENWVTRRNLAALWGVCDEPYRTKVLTNLLSDPRTEVRVEALGSLTKFPSGITERLLLDHFNRELDNGVKGRILTLLGQVGSTQTVKELTPHLQKRRLGKGDVTEGMQQEICQLFGTLHLPEASKELLKVAREKGLLKGPPIALQVSAIHALGKYDTNEVKRFLLQLRNDTTDNRLRMAAQHALKEMSTAKPAGRAEGS